VSIRGTIRAYRNDIQRKISFMNESTIWWLIAGSLVGIELMTGTFYLLMLAIGASAGAIAAHAQLSFTTQLITGSVLGGLAVILWRIYSLQKLKSHPEQVSAQHLDVGETVEVYEWLSNGTAQVKHRGANWTAVCASGVPQVQGVYQIQDIQGNTLVLHQI
jgi:membrane protein implicated in regulation of membrane protease activity